MMAQKKIACAAIALASLFSASQASALECSAEFQIQQSFANGAAWEMCFEEQSREGIVLRDINYTSPTGVKRRVLYQANLAQIHVPYDDDGARYHDVSDFGLGGSRLNDLTPADCPDGTLKQNGSKDVICQTVHDAATLATANEVRYGEMLSVFSVSHVGAYNYIPDWRFFDDGTIEPAIGATGRLQRYTDSEAYGWPVRTGSSPVGVSHIHNYYWRLDFDLDGGDDDRFEELEFVDAAGGRRDLQATQFAGEAARSLNASTQRFWRVYDAGTHGGSGRPISYDIVPLDTGHRDIGPTFEPWTFNDIYATTYRACERFISHNPADSAGGCLSNGDVSSFVNGEAIDTSDLVVWFGLTFHHTPRDEDEAYMNAHWNSFRLAPRDWLDVGSSNSNPVIERMSDRLDIVGDAPIFSASALDSDGDALTFSATGLPPGMTISANGELSGTLSTAGTYAVRITATDSLQAFNSTGFQWNVQPANACSGCVNFVSVANESYGRQDIAGNSQVQNVGATLYLQDNTWRRTESTFDITPNTVLEFDFASSAQGEIHGIGFDKDLVLSQDQVFQLYGTQTWGLQGFEGYTPAEFVSYQIPVGQFYTGSDMHMVFANDNDAGSGNSSRFRNLRVFEATSSVPPPGGGNDNLAPLVENPGDQSSTIGAGTNLAIAATDVENDVLSFFSSGLPGGLSLNAQTGLISGSPDVPGSYAVTVEVSDGGSNTSIAFDWLVEAQSLDDNVAINGVASQSSTLDIPVDLSAGKAIDGNRDGNFGAGSLSHTDFDSQPWWQVDLNARYAISDVEVYNREDCCTDALSDFYVLASDQPFAADSLDSLLGNPNVTAIHVAGEGGRPSRVALNIEARYVRVQLVNAQYLQLAEVEVRGTPADGSGINLAPVLFTPGDQTFNLGSNQSFMLAASDPEGDSLSF